MKKLVLRGLTVSSLFIFALQVNAQKPKAAKPRVKTTPSSGAKDPFGNPVNQSSKPAAKDPFGNPTTPASGNNKAPIDPFSNPNANGGGVRKSGIPILPMKASNGNNPLTDTVKVSLRNDNVIESSQIKERTPLPYDHIREDDAVYKQRFWRIIDAREKANLSFRYPVVGDNGSELFFAILFRAISEGGVTAFEDDRFTKPYTKEKFIQELSGGMDTSDVIGLDGEISGRQPAMREFPIDSIYQFQIKDETVFDKESSRLVTRILGIAPMGPLMLPSGKIIEGPAQPKFWVYYPDVRAYLSRREVYNPKNFGNKMSWEDLFESRMFSSYIIKTTLDNPYDIKLTQKYEKNKLLMFYEGEAIKEKVFNYEQDLWAY